MERFLGGNPNFVRIPFFHKFFLFFFNFSSYFHFDIFWDACFFFNVFVKCFSFTQGDKVGVYRFETEFLG